MKLLCGYTKLLMRPGSVQRLGVLGGLTLCFVLFLVLSKTYDAERRKYGEGMEAAGATAAGQFMAESSPNFKILCYVLLDKSKVRAAQILKETWGSRCQKLVFYGNFVSNEIEVTRINVTEGYEFLWGKTKAALIHLNEHFSGEFDWFLKADLDTFVLLENLRGFIASLKYNIGPVWFGYKMKHKKMTQGYMSGGAGYVFNKAALKNVTSLLAKYAHNDYYRFEADLKKPVGCRSAQDAGIEDLELGRCFVAAGVNDVPTQDNEGRERFLPTALSKLMTGDLPGVHWIWSHAWNPVRPGNNCCSSQLISMHEVTPSQMKILYYLLYRVERMPTANAK